MDLRHPHVGIHAHRARVGLRWFMRGVELVQRQTLGLTACALFYLLMHLPAMLPVVGMAIATVLAPFATLGLMSACRESAQGRTPTAQVYLDLFQNEHLRRKLFRLGIANAILTLIMLMGMLLTGLGQTLPAQPAPDAPIELDWTVLAAASAFYLPVVIMMWFAPMLVGWHGVSVPKALFGSAVACWKNLASMSVFMLIMVAVLVALGSVIGVLFTALGIGEQIGTLLIAPFALILLAVMQAGIYVMYTDIIETITPPETEDASAPEEPSSV